MIVVVTDDCAAAAAAARQSHLPPIQSNFPMTYTTAAPFTVINLKTECTSVWLLVV